MPQVLLYVVMGAWLAVVVIGYPLVFVVTARRPADDRDGFVRKLPPPSHPPAVRAAHLRGQLAQEVKKVAKIYAVSAGVLLVVGVLAALGVDAPIGEGIAALAVTLGLPYLFGVAFTGLYLLARYRGAQLRIRNDARWHAGGDQPPAVPDGS